MKAYRAEILELARKYGAREGKSLDVEPNNSVCELKSTSSCEVSNKCAKVENYDGTVLEKNYKVEIDPRVVENDRFFSNKISYRDNNISFFDDEIIDGDNFELSSVFPRNSSYDNTSCASVFTRNSSYDTSCASVFPQSSIYDTSVESACSISAETLSDICTSSVASTVIDFISSNVGGV